MHQINVCLLRWWNYLGQHFKDVDHGLIHGLYKPPLWISPIMCVSFWTSYRGHVALAPPPHPLSLMATPLPTIVSKFIHYVGNNCSYFHAIVSFFPLKYCTNNNTANVMGTTRIVELTEKTSSITTLASANAIVYIYECCFICSICRLPS